MPVGFAGSGRTVTSHQDEEGAKREREKHKPKADGTMLAVSEVASVLTWRERTVDAVRRFRAWDKANLERLKAVVMGNAR